MDEEESTPNEEEQAQETGETSEEAHRAGEFDELRAMLREVIEGIASISERIGGLVDSANAVAVENGAVVNDGAQDAGAPESVDVIVSDEVENPYERDYSIER